MLPPKPSDYGSTESAFFQGEGTLSRLQNAAISLCGVAPREQRFRHSATHEMGPPAVGREGQRVGVLKALLRLRRSTLRDSLA